MYGTDKTVALPAGSLQMRFRLPEPQPTVLPVIINHRSGFSPMNPAQILTRYLLMKIESNKILKKQSGIGSGQFR